MSDDGADARRVAPVEPPNEFNINEYVWVKVTEAGFRVLADADAKLNAQFPKAPTFDRAGHVRSEQEQHDGWSKWQLWSLMAAFGPSIYLVCDQPFETTIRFGEAQRIAAPPEGTLVAHPMDVAVLLTRNEVVEMSRRLSDPDDLHPNHTRAWVLVALEQFAVLLARQPK